MEEVGADDVEDVVIVGLELLELPEVAVEIDDDNVAEADAV